MFIVKPMGFYDLEVIRGDGRRHGIKILPVDINRSMWNCSLENGLLRIGCRHVKGVGKNKSDRILKARELGPFVSLQHCADRTRLDNESLQNFIAVGAFEMLQQSRRQLLWEAGTIREAGGLSGMNSDRQEKLPILENMLLFPTENVFKDVDGICFPMDLSVLSSEEDMPLSAAIYRLRRPQDSDYYRCVEDYFETFVQIYDEHFFRQYGFWRPYVE